jgi:predicted kinase
MEDIMRKLIFFLGGAGAGKTTLAKAMAQKRRIALLDMDSLSRPASEALMTLAGLDPSDRDSPAYKSLCRDVGYRLTMNAALDNLEIGMDAAVIGPFTKEAGDAGWLERELGRIGASTETVDVKVVYVYLPDEQAYRHRIEQRQSRLDRWKLDNWDSFKSSLAKREVKWQLPPGAIVYFDNSQPLTEEVAARLERLVYGEGESE